MTTPHERLTNEHYAELQRSALTEETMLACEFFSAPPFRLNALPSAWQEQVKSAMGIPYFAIDGTRTQVERLKLFPAAKDKEGKEVRYWQPRNTDSRLYFPPLMPWNKIVADPTVRIYFTEGEKKECVLSQHGFACVALAGCWNWIVKQQDGTRLDFPELDLFDFDGRPVEILPDSDGWRPNKLTHVVGAFYAFAIALSRRGARVAFVRIPE